MSENETQETAIELVKDTKTEASEKVTAEAPETPETIADPVEEAAPAATDSPEAAVEVPESKEATTEGTDTDVKTSETPVAPEVATESAAEATDAPVTETTTGEEAAPEEPVATAEAAPEKPAEPEEPEEPEEISYHAVEKEGEITAIWEMQGRKHIRTISARSSEGQKILSLFTSEIHETDSPAMGNTPAPEDATESKEATSEEASA